MSNTNLKRLMAVHRYVSVFCCVALLLLATKVNSQNAGAGNIQGTVTDATGALVANAKVTLAEPTTAVTHETMTDNAGVYVFPNIPIATYNLIVTAPGFETYEQTGIVLEVGSNIAINPSLAVGRADQKIEVRAEGLALQTEDATYKQTIDSTQILEMPLNGRHMTDLLAVSGGTASASGNDFTGSKYSYAAVAISVAGGMGNSTLWRLDGADNGDYMAGANLPFPFPDAVNQFSVEASTLGAQDGMHAGGMVNVVTRSGTNQFHGSGFEFIRNNFIDATNFFAICSPVPPATSCSAKDQLHQDQYGGTVGGPVWLPKLYNGKDRLFFFAGFQYTRSVSSSATSNAYVPTAANLAGDFRETAGAPDTNTPPNSLCNSKGATQLVDPITGDIVPNNVYATAPTWNPVSLALQKYLSAIKPLPDSSDACGHVTYAIPNENFDKQFITRVDYKIGPKDNLFGRYLLDSYQLPSFFFPTNILVTTQSGNPEQRVQTGTAGEDHVFSSNLVNSAHIALLRRLNHRGYNPSDINACDLGDSITCGVPVGLNLGTGGNGIGGFSMGGSTNSLAHFNDNTLSIDDDVTWVHGKHQFVFGGEYVYNQLNISNAFNSNGVFSFGSNYSANGPYGAGSSGYGDGALDFLEGAMSGFSQSKQQQNALRTPIPSLYVQDTLHATKKLTLVLGLRWDPNFEPIDVFNRGETFRYSAFLAGQHSSVYPAAPAGVFFYGDPGVPREFTQNSPNQWDPNFGFTYDPNGDGKTVLRGGVEYIYDTPNAFTMQRNQQNPPFATSVGQSLNTYIPFANPWSVPSVSFGPGAANSATVYTNPFPTPASFVGRPSASTAIFPKNAQYIVPVAKFHPAVYLQWTASIQLELPRGWQAQIQYIGSKGTHEEYGAPLDPVEYIPGKSNGITGPTNCNVSINGTVFYLGEPGASPVPKAGANCSSTSNNAQRAVLTLENPAQGIYYGGGTTSQFVSDTAYSTYNGIVASINHRLSSTFSLLANYTWSKCLDIEDNQGDVSGVTVENPNNPRLDHGPCGFDFRNIANVVLVAKSGFHFNNRAESLILNDWEFSGLSHMQSGSPFSVTLGGKDDSLTAVGNDRATQIPGIPVYQAVSFRSTSGEANREYLNPAAFVTSITPTPPTSPVSLYGNTGRNAFHGPILVNFDGQISRIFPIHERLNLDTRIEAFNVLNHPCFGTPNGNALSGSFGQVSGTANGARVFQGAIKVTF